MITGLRLQRLLTSCLWQHPNLQSMSLANCNSPPPPPPPPPPTHTHTPHPHRPHTHTHTHADTNPVPLPPPTLRLDSHLLQPPSTPHLDRMPSVGHSWGRQSRGDPEGTQQNARACYTGYPTLYPAVCLTTALVSCAETSGSNPAEKLISFSFSFGRNLREAFEASMMTSPCFSGWSVCTVTN